MKQFAITLLLLLFVVPTEAQTPKFRNSYYDCRREAHTREGLPTGGIVWIGDSITEQGWWSMLSRERGIANRGIGGDNTYGMLDRLPEILASKPRKIFLMAGINDLSAGYPVADIYANIRRMVELIQKEVPNCAIYLQSVLTPNNEVLAYDYIKNKQGQVRELNSLLQTLCKECNVQWVDVAALVSNEQGELRRELTKDGVHLHPEAYVIWVDHLKKMRYLRR